MPYVGAAPGTTVGTQALTAPLLTRTPTLYAPTVSGSGSVVVLPPATHYIATTGSDSTGNGTLASPYATVGKFLSVASRGASLQCRGGNYGTVAITVGVADVTISAYGSETPVFHVARSTMGFTIAATGVTLDGLTIDGPGADIFGNAFGVYSAGIYEGLTVTNCTITDMDFSGIFVINSAGQDDITIDDNVIARCTYSGITMQATGGSCQRNDVRDIGVDYPGSGSDDWNAYGIAITADQYGVPSTAVLVQDNYIDNVPLWHGLDTHGGIGLRFIHNEIHNCARAIFITSTNTVDAQNCDIAYNLCDDPLTAPNGTDAGIGITTYETINCKVRNNVVGTGYPNITYDSGGLSTGLVITGNTRGSTLPTLP